MVHLNSTLRRFCLVDARSDFDMKLFGFVLSHTEVGYAVVLIENRRVPYVLRRAGHRGARAAWKFLGDAYVEGVMEGEWMKIGAMEEAVLVKAFMLLL